MSAMDANMTVVMADEFFDFLKRDPRDIMPSHQSPDYTEWKVQGTGVVVGKTRPGWKRPSEPKVYMLAAHLVRT
jgi:hypothetical protein